LISCGEKPNDIDKVAQEIALQQAYAPAPLPADCRVNLPSGVQLGEPMKRTLLRLNARLDQQNQRISRCADWRDTVFVEVK